MTISVLKRYMKKKNPIIISYRNYKNYNEDNFRYDLIRELELSGNENVNDFKSTFMRVLDVHVPSKRKVIVGNNMKFSPKHLCIDPN